MLRSERVLGIDPGTGRMGFGVIDVTKGRPNLIDGGVITTKPHTPEPERLATLYTELEEIIAEHQPSVMAIEKLFFAQNVTTAINVAQARGVILLLAQLQQISVVEYTPLQIKMALTGYGRATKQQIQEMVKVLLKLDSVPKPDDCADALAIALVHGHGIRVE